LFKKNVVSLFSKNEEIAPIKEEPKQSEIEEYKKDQEDVFASCIPVMEEEKSKVQVTASNVTGDHDEVQSVRESTGNMEVVNSYEN
jgi:hypothetical protein